MHMVYLVIAALLLGTCAPAHAYIDAGSGSYMIQMAMAGVLAAVFTMKLAWLRLKASAARFFNGSGRPGTRGGA
jgi:hypothetical protein